MSIGAPATNPSGDLELKLPATIGTANQVIANGSTPGTLEFVENDSRTLLSTTTLSGTSTVVSVDLTGYQHLEGLVYGLVNSSSPNYIQDTFIRVNSLSTDIYSYVLHAMDYNGTGSTQAKHTISGIYYNLAGTSGWENTNNWAAFNFLHVNGGSRKFFNMNAGGDGHTGGEQVLSAVGYVELTSAITSIQFACTDTITAGTLKLYGVK